MSYIFVNNEPFLGKINYSHSECGKLDFISHFIEYRKACLERAKLAKFVQEELQTEVENGSDIDILTFLRNFKPSVQDIKVLDKLIQKFNVFQRIYRTYSFDYKKKNKDASCVEIYILLAKHSLDLFESKGTSNYLDLVLKINDLLCSLSFESFTGTEHDLFVELLEHELLVVQRLESCS